MIALSQMLMGDHLRVLVVLHRNATESSLNTSRGRKRLPTLGEGHDVEGRIEAVGSPNLRVDTIKVCRPRAGVSGSSFPFSASSRNIE